VRLERSLVLVVDDNTDAADMTAEVLRMHGFDVVVAYGGIEGLEMARKLMPSVVVLDVGMPMMDGCAVAAALRREAAFVKVKLVALTAWDDEESRERTRLAGFDLHLTKPAALASLIEAVLLPSRSFELAAV
jgi:CheY-like chemotaxis protein